MKIFVKTLKGTNFEIEVKPSDSVSDVKKAIETTHGAIYPAPQQMLIYQGKVLINETTLEENSVVENSFIVIMLSKAKVSSSGPSTASAPAQAPAPAPAQAPAPAPAQAPAPAPAQAPAPAPSATQAQTVTTPQVSAPTVSVSAPTCGTATDTAPAAVSAETYVYGETASIHIPVDNLESTVQQILDMGGGSWDRNTVNRALRAAYNNPERAVEYLYSGIPAQAEIPLLPQAQSTGGPNANPLAPPQQEAPAAATGGPNANPLNLFPQGMPAADAGAGAGNLDFLRNSQQFQALRAMVQANPQILQPMLQELGKQNPQLVRLIQEHQADFLRLINEPVEGEENVVEQLEGAMPEAVTVTPEEREAIERLEAMGFDSAMVLEVFFACNKNEELAANYLLDHMHEFEDQQ